MILVSTTYEVWSPEAIEAGDTDDRGFESQDVPFKFRELVKHIKSEGFYEFSDSHYNSAHTWISTPPDIDYQDGSYEIKSIHFAHGQPARTEKYWVKALEVARGYYARL